MTIIFFDNNNVAEPAETTTSKIRSANFESSTKNIAKFQRNVFWKNREACGASREKKIESRRDDDFFR